jgi:4-carboxymuconolactone decarboxylase
MTSDRFNDGLAVRKEVLGEAYVERSLANATAFTQPLQELVTEYCWGSIWTREDLPRQTRSLLNVAMMTVMNRPHELELHLRGAFRNGCTPEQVREVLLQAAIYAGVPAAIDGFRVATAVLAEQEPTDGDAG